jgi:hypothetical protein
VVNQWLRSLAVELVWLRRRAVLQSAPRSLMRVALDGVAEGFKAPVLKFARPWAATCCAVQMCPVLADKFLHAVLIDRSASRSIKLSSVAIRVAGWQVSGAPVRTNAPILEALRPAPSKDNPQAALLSRRVASHVTACWRRPDPDRQSQPIAVDEDQ